MDNKRNYVVSLLNSFGDCVLSSVVSASSYIEAADYFVSTVLVSIGGDVFSRFQNGEFTVSCSFDDSDFLGGD